MTEKFCPLCGVNMRKKKKHIHYFKCKNKDCGHKVKEG
jgi:hypothetical protein